VGKEHLRKLASYRIYMPELLGKLAARGLAGVDGPGKERLATLKLEALYGQLKAKAWGTPSATLDFVNNLGVPLLATFHDEQLASQAKVPKERIYTDVMRLQSIASPMAQVLRLCNIPLTGNGSVKHWLQALLDVFFLHAPGCSEEQYESMCTAFHTYVIDSLEQYVRRFNQARLEADALTDGAPLQQLNSTLRSLNATTARKRSATSSLDSVRIVLPRVAVGSIALFARSLGTTSPRPGGATSPRPGGNVTWADRAAGGGTGQSAAHLVSNGWKYDVPACRTWLARNGHGELCAHALLLSGIKRDDVKAREEAAHCPHFGQAGHTVGGELHRPPAGFNARDFVLENPYDKK